MTVKKVAKNPIFLKFLTFYEPNLRVEFFGFSPAGPKTKADPLDSQQWSKDKINTKSDMCEVLGCYNFYLEKFGCQLR